MKILVIFLLLIVAFTVATKDFPKKELCLMGCKLLKKDWQRELCEIGCNQIKSDNGFLKVLLKNYAKKMLKKEKKNLLSEGFPSHWASINPQLFAKTNSDSQLMTGDHLQATVSVNVRSGPCSTYLAKTVLYSGEVVRYEGQTQTGCSNTWYKVSGFFGEGWIASFALKETSLPVTTSAFDQSLPSGIFEY